MGPSLCKVVSGTAQGFSENFCCWWGCDEALCKADKTKGTLEN